ncbi:hypothetical protein ACO1MN_14395, partial [Staphylococcus aureus]
FVLEAISSNLNTYWSEEYLYKQTEEYKELCFLRSLTQYLKIDSVPLKKVELLYHYTLNKEIKSLEQDFNKNDKIIDLNQFKKEKQSNKTFKNRML